MRVSTIFLFLTSTLLLSSFLWTTELQAQTESTTELESLEIEKPEVEKLEIEKYQGLLDPKEKISYKGFALEGTNEVKIFLTGLFLFYKEFISSQDGQSCSFTPSCSVYAIQCIKKHGILRGFFDTLDRLMRCNSLSPEKYELDHNSRLLIDPVD